MAFDLGDVVPLSTEVRDENGQLADAGNMRLEITLPNQTQDVTDPVTSTTTGVYDHDFPTIQAGRHLARWVATGLNAGAYVDTFDVREATPPYIVSLADTKTQLNIIRSIDDEELRGFIESATGIVENHVGACVRRTVTEQRNGGRSAVSLLITPVIEVTSVTESGTLLTAVDWSLSDGGILTKVSGIYPLSFPYGINNIVIVYVVGRIVIPAQFTHAARIIIQHLWETQRSRDVRRPPTALAGELARVQDQAGRTFTVPRKAVELLTEVQPGFA